MVTAVFRNIWLLVFLVIALISFPQVTPAGEDNPDKIPDRYGLTVNIGNTYDPSGDTGFIMLSDSGFTVLTSHPNSSSETAGS